MRKTTIYNKIQTMTKIVRKQNERHLTKRNENNFPETAHRAHNEMIFSRKTDRPNVKLKVGTEKHITTANY